MITTDDANDPINTDTPSTRLWRSLIRVDHITPHFAYIVIPGYAPDRYLSISFSQFPDNIAELIRQGRAYFHAHVNIGAERDSDLRFEQWEEE